MKKLLDRSVVASVLTGVASVVVLSACVVADEPEDSRTETGSTSAALCGVPIQPERSLIIHRSDFANESPTILDAFSFKSVLDAIVASASNTTTTSTQLYREWMSVAEQATAPGAVGAFHCDTPGVDPNRWGYECPRPQDAALADVDPFAPADRFVPVALVNRIDLMSPDASDCGEYRIVFAKNQVVSPGRFFFIFEARLPNPGGVGNRAACKAVAEAWQKLSSPTMTTIQRRDALRAFYFDGIPLDLPTGKVRTRPIFTWKNYASELGQVRTNQFVQPPWDLREFKLGRACDDGGSCELRAKPVTVKTNMADEPLADTNNPLHTAAVKAIQSNLTTGALLATSAAAITATIPNKVNSWESRDDFAIDYAIVTPQNVQDELVMPPGTLTTRDALERLTTQSCMGCHERSNGRFLGDGVFWPRSLGFVHVDEQGQISQALQQSFLPARATFMEAIVNAGCPGNVAEPQFKPVGSVN